MQKHIAVPPASSSVNVRTATTPRGLVFWLVESAAVPLVALDATLLELFGPRGTDNLLVPLGVLALLAALEHSVAATVLLHVLGAAAALVVRARQLRMAPQP